MFFGGRGTVGFCGTTKNPIDTSVSWTENCSGVGQRGRTHPQSHAGVPIPRRMGGVGKMGLADRVYIASTAAHDPKLDGAAVCSIPPTRAITRNSGSEARYPNPGSVDPEDW